MSNELKTVSLVTENCEIFTFDAKHVTWLEYHINQEITFPYDTDMTEAFGMCFAKDTELLIEETQAFSFAWKERNDITVVELVFDDGSIRSINLHWPEGEENRYLTSHPGQCWRETPNGRAVLTHFIADGVDYEKVSKDMFDLDLLDE